MSTQYNLVADQYDLSFQLAPYRLYVEAYSVLELLGDVSGKSVLDLATGTGFYARVVRKAGASKVVAVDIAGDMVQIGRMAEENEPLGIEYHTQDIMQFSSDEPFDIGLAVYLLHYAPSKEALAMMCQAIAQNIQSGGRFITYILNPNLARDPNYYQEYGLNVNFQSHTPSDGEPVPFSISLGGMTTPEIMAYRWDKETIDNILQNAGFDDVEWVMPTLSAEGERQHGADYYATYMQQPHAVLLTCVKK
ncbi:MAG: methyltransferase domain-containing protein [Anaerolineae bacterium]|nr:methyltransferase domain-containing protein [Anaerolineae bacterium]